MTEHRPWTGADNAMLCELWRQKVPIDEVAAQLDRTVGAVRTHAGKLGLGNRDIDGYRWTGKELEHLDRLKAMNVSIPAMAAAIGRSEKAVKTKLGRLRGHVPPSKRSILSPHVSAKPDRRRKDAGGSNPDRAMRRCLGGCNEMFDSSFIGNRICEHCKARGHSNAALEGMSA